MIQDNLIIGAVALTIGAGSSWWLTAEYKNAKHDAFVKDLKATAADRLLTLTKKHEEEATRDRATATQLQGDYDAKLKEFDAKLSVASKSKPTRGLSVYCPAASSGSPVPGPAGSPPSPQDLPVEARVSDALREDILWVVTEVNHLRIWGEACYKFVNEPSCVCSRR